MIHQYWQQLTDKEKQALLIGGILLFLYLIYLLIYHPLHQAMVDKTEALLEKQTTLTSITSVRQQLLNQTKQDPIEASALLTLITQQLKNGAFKEFSYQLQQRASDEIELSYSKVPFNLWTQWFYRLQQRYAFGIKQLFIEKTDQAGLVHITLRITLKN